MILMKKKIEKKNIYKKFEEIKSWKIMDEFSKFV